MARNESIDKAVNGWWRSSFFVGWGWVVLLDFAYCIVEGPI